MKWHFKQSYEFVFSSFWFQTILFYLVILKVVFNLRFSKVKLLSLSKKVKNKTKVCLLFIWNNHKNNLLITYYLLTEHPGTKHLSNINCCTIFVCIKTNLIFFLIANEDLYTGESKIL